MRPIRNNMNAGSEIRFGETCVGRSNTMMFLYARYKPRTTAHPKQYIPTITRLNAEFGDNANLKFMRRHELPDTLKGVTGYVTRTQLLGDIFFLDLDTNRYYLAQCTDKMDMRLSRRHFVAWDWSIAPRLQVDPKQNIIQAVQVTSNKELKAFTHWYDKLKGAEEAINILEPDRERLRSTRQTLLSHDFCAMIKEAYLESRTPASLLADISARNYTIPPATHCGVGTVSRYNVWLTQP